MIAVIQPQDFQTAALQWVAVATTLAGILSTFAVYIVGKVNEVKKAVAAHDVQIAANQTQITAVALATPAPATAVTK